MEISHVPSCYDKKQLPSLTSTQLVLFDEVYIKQVSGSPTTIQMDEYSIFFPRYEEVKVDVERGVYDTNNQPKSATFMYEEKGRFCLVGSKVESK